jgi:hypothetical protein
MNALASEWLALAPKAEPLPDGKKWHVFLSYRSVNRSWVLQLYEVLHQLEYQVFLDQYVLSAAASLAYSLGEELDASASAIMIWSSAYEDSEWCKEELAKLITMERERRGFSYCVAKIDDAPIKGLAAVKLWVDFSEHREGPSGAGLLRLLYGLNRRPLPPGGVALADAIDQEMKAELTRITAARMNGDVETLRAIATGTSRAWASCTLLPSRTAEALIALGHPDEALPILDAVQATFPKSLRPKQLRALAFARQGTWQAAQKILGELYAAGEIDPETLGLYARTWMDRYKQTQHRPYLLRSRDLYRQAFEATQNDVYTGINAATKSLLLGERETAAQLAARVEEIVKSKARRDYWDTATFAETQLLQGRYREAGTLYMEAVATAPEELGSHKSTREQARLILENQNASSEDRRIVLEAFAHLEQTGSA